MLWSSPADVLKGYPANVETCAVAIALEDI